MQTSKLCFKSCLSYLCGVDAVFIGVDLCGMCLKVLFTVLLNLYMYIYTYMYMTNDECVFTVNVYLVSACMLCFRKPVFCGPVEIFNVVVESAFDIQDQLFVNRTCAI